MSGNVYVRKLLLRAATEKRGPATYGEFRGVAIDLDSNNVGDWDQSRTGDVASKWPHDDQGAFSHDP